MTHVTGNKAEHGEAKPQQQQPDERYWRQEFEDLDRYFKNLLTPKQAQHWADEELRRHDEIVNRIEAEITKIKTLDVTFFRRDELQATQRKIEDLEHHLENAKKLRQLSIGRCGAGIRSSKEWEPKRKRWEELRNRAHRIENAARLVKGW